MTNNYLIIDVDKDQQATVTVDNLVKFSGNDYDSIRKLIGENKEEINELGKSIPLDKRGYADLKSASFNEQQATYLISLMKNSPEVKAFKLKLTKEFYLQRQMLQQMFQELKELRQQQELLLLNKNKTIETLKELPKEYKKFERDGNVYISAAALVKDEDYSAKDFKNFVKQLGLISEKPKLQSYWTVSEKGELSDLIIAGDTNSTPYYDAVRLKELFEEYLERKSQGEF
jgi:uncharacterized membrane-anchored protein YhcB (DUF1043 family)